jgi:hypothetical protein
VRLLTFLSDFVSEDRYPSTAEKHFQQKIRISDGHGGWQIYRLC